MRKRMLLARLIAWSSACKLHPSSQNRSRIVALVIGVWIREENNKAVPIYKHHPVKLLVSEKIVLPSIVPHGFDVYSEGKNAIYIEEDNMFLHYARKQWQQLT
jgi:hypothetical protein